MTYWLSRPVEVLLQAEGHPVTDIPLKADSALPPPVLLQQSRDVLIIGSGYGAAMAALALAEQEQQLPPQRRRRIEVFERGDEYLPQDFPKSLRDLPTRVGVITKPQENAITEQVEPNRLGLWDIRVGHQCSTLMGNGLGGTSLVNASVAARPPASALAHWPAPDFGTAGGWQTELEAVYSKIERLLGVQTLPDAERFPKYQALARSVQAMGGSVAPAPLTINFDAPGVHSADHGPCNRCGNCVIGCHSGAKGSLNLNAWPLARQLGVALFTGATVRALRPAPAGGWLLDCLLTRAPGRYFTVHARTVILSAGSVGSTEILLRSRQTQGLSLSDNLGRKFSPNGDMLLFTAGQQTPVQALAAAPAADRQPLQPCGPTIIGKASVPLASDRDTQRFTLEDGAVPYPIIALWQELMVTQSFLRRYVDGAPHAWQKAHPQHDPLAVSRDLATRSQVLLAMGVDTPAPGDPTAWPGELVLDGTRDAVLPHLNFGADESGFFHTLHQRLRKAERKAFDGGHYVPSAAWAPLPEGFGEQVEGADDLGRHVLTVHPLGGCAMAADAAQGVVDARGRVFSGLTGSAVHPGLYVLDGAILPGAVGTNPFLTISALCYRLAVALAQEHAVSAAPDDLPGAQLALPWWQADFPLLDKARWGQIPAGALQALPTPAEEHVQASFSETLVHWFNNDNRSKLPWSETLTPGPEAVVQVLETLDLPPRLLAELRRAPSLVLSIEFQFSGETALERWIETPDLPLPAIATLGYDAVGAVLETRAEHCMPLLQLKGSVVLGKRDQVNGFQTLHRTLKAAGRFLHYRRADVDEGLLATLKKLPRIGEYLRVARVHADWRELQYRLQGEFAGGTTLTLSGRKTLGYAREQKNLLAALMTLPVQLHNSRNDARVELLLEVDPVGITRGPAPLQLRGVQDGVTALLRVGGFGAYFLRLLMQTHFWSFGAYSYKRFKPLEELDADPVRGRLAAPPEQMAYSAGGRQRLSQPLQIFLNQDAKSGRTVTRLLRYQPATAPRGPGPRKSLILVHGLAHSGRVFWTDTIDTNYVQYFLAQDYDVWVLDHRTSASIVDEIHSGDTWDDIAALDMPWGVRTVFETLNGERPGPQAQKVYVFGHCIGAGAMAIATLRGLLDYRLPDGGRASMVAAMALHAVAPWLYASAANRARENLWALFKELDLIDTVEPRPHKGSKGAEVIYDRLASTSLNEAELAQWPDAQMKDDERGPAFQKAIYTRYTVFWGRQWVKANVTERTRKEFCGMIGAVPVAVLQQVYYSITRGLLAAHRGDNDYVRHEALKTHWDFPTFFLHGNQNTVFDMATARNSAEQLVRHRRHVREADTHWRPDLRLEPQDYLEEEVWVDVVEGYGHMDMIFGREVARDICPRLHTFFEAAAQQQLPQTYAHVANHAQERLRFQRWCQGNAHSTPPGRPLAGPILSHPRRTAAGLGSLRLWCEAQDFTANPASGLRIALSNVEELPPGESLRRLRHLVPGDVVAAQAWQREFWLHDYQFHPRADMQRRIRLEYDPEESDKVVLPPRPAPGKTLDPHDPTVQTPQRWGMLLDWAAMPWFQRAFLEQQVPQDLVVLSFLSGSCLHPGSTFEEQNSSAIFLGMCRHVAPGYAWPGLAVTSDLLEEVLPGHAPLRGVDHLLLLGDQIYADASAGLFDPRVEYEKYRTPYRKAFGSAAARRLLSHLPTYFTIDDHEIDDNWDGRLQKDGSPVNPWYARRMAWLYQVHQRQWDHEQIQLWQHFTSAGQPFFLFDTRMERRNDRPHSEPDALLSATQRAEFEAWLRSAEVQQGECVFFATGSALAPIAWPVLQESVLAAQEDSLLAYPGFLAWLIDTLHAQCAGKRVFWYTGDPHFSCTARVQLQHADASVALTQVCCSGLYSPYAFANANPGNHRWDTPFLLTLPLTGTDVRISGTQQLLSASRQHFVRSDLLRHDGRLQLRVQAFDAAGAPASAPVLL